MESKAIRVYDDRAYMVADEMYTQYESGVIHFVNHDAVRVFPKVFGRAGDGFNVTFHKTDNTVFKSDAERSPRR